MSHHHHNHHRSVIAVLSLSVTAFLLMTSPSLAQQADQMLSDQHIAKWGSMQKVGGREFKFLIDPKWFSDGGKKDRKKKYKIIWKKLKAAAKDQDFKIKGRKKKKYKEKKRTREYFDTADFQLRKKGYVVRISTNYKKKEPQHPFTLTVKEGSRRDFKRVLNSTLSFSGAHDGKTEIEENISFGPDGRLRSSLEISKKIKLEPEELGKMTLGDFGKVVPRLLKLGLPAETKLIRHTAYSMKIKLGKVKFGDGVKAKLDLEVWLKNRGELPFVGEISYTVDTEDYAGMAGVHAKSEAFMKTVIGKIGKEIGFQNAAKWGGSKTRMLLNLPVN
jgi:hypothetical protein